jgi:hypothetical protein
MTGLTGTDMASGNEQRSFLTPGGMRLGNLCFLFADITDGYLLTGFGQRIQFFFNLPQPNGSIELTSPEQSGFTVRQLPAAVFSAEDGLPFIPHETVEGKPGICLFSLDLILFSVSE